MIIGEKVFSGGSSNQIPINQKEVLKQAVIYSCEALVIMHNHPNSTSTPSKLDIVNTNKLLLSLKSLDIRLFDHIIFGTNGSFSFQQNGLI